MSLLSGQWQEHERSNLRATFTNATAFVMVLVLVMLVLVLVRRFCDFQEALSPQPVLLSNQSLGRC